MACLERIYPGLANMPKEGGREKKEKVGWEESSGAHQKGGQVMVGGNHLLNLASWRRGVWDKRKTSTAHDVPSRHKNVKKPVKPYLS